MIFRWRGLRHLARLFFLNLFLPLSVKMQSVLTAAFWNVYRACYLGLTAMLWTLVLVVTRDTINRLELTAAILLDFAASVSYFAIQGSAPGYVEELLESNTSTESDVEDQQSLVKFKEGSKLFRADTRRCSLCDMQVPLRSYHCKECKHCVHKFDHHCSVIGTCIGERNHCRFWWMLLWHSILISFVLFGPLRDVDNEYALIITVLLGFHLFWLSLLLLIHTFLALNNSTTFEYMRLDEEVTFVSSRVPSYALPFVNRTVTAVLDFCCYQDEICWGNRGWLPTLWTAKVAVDASHISVYDDIFDNEYYNCC